MPVRSLKGDDALPLGTGGAGDPLLREMGPGPLEARMRVTQVSYGTVTQFRDQ